MSLSEFVLRPAIKEAFIRLAMKERTPASLRASPLLVPATGKHHGRDGTAFDYLARFHLARTLRDGPVVVHERQWAAEAGLTRLPTTGLSAADASLWRKAVADARAEARGYVEGGGDLARLVEASQWLANADVLLRHSAYFDPAVRPSDDLSEELVRLLKIFANVPLLVPTALCILNPKFVAADRVNGADADLLIDARLIDLKTSAQPRVDLDALLQVAGYAALHRMGGIALTTESFTGPIERVGFYFSRFGKLCEWSIDELFPNQAFSQFCAVFEREIDQL